jgi:hypothetical protein
VGVALYVALDGDAWLAMIAGGVVALACGFALKEVDSRVEAPPGYHFCPFCSTLVAEGAERCSHCNGLQDWAEQRKVAPLQPND